jgi:Fe-S-cluster containining protein
MEFTIDFELVRKLISEERTAAATDIDGPGPIAALAQSQFRHDVQLAAASDADSLACRSGCSWCCHFTIDARAVEVFRILDHLATMSASEQQRLRERIERNAQRLAGLDEDERARTNVECAFLLEGRCSIYTVRPQTCRNYHATDASGCQQAFEQPDNEDIDPAFAPVVYQIGRAHVEAFAQALSHAHFDAQVYEFNAALLAAMNGPATLSQFLSKVQPFTDLIGMEVPPEFLDEDEE